MTRDAKALRVRELEGGVESAPENDTRDKTGQHQKTKAEDRARPSQHVPDFQGKIERALPERRPRCFRRRHRGFPGPLRVKSVSMSTKSFVIGGCTLC